jgi:hypothetical protein
MAQHLVITLVQHDPRDHPSAARPTWCVVKDMFGTSMYYKKHNYIIIGSVMSKPTAQLGSRATICPPPPDGSTTYRYTVLP